MTAFENKSFKVPVSEKVSNPEEFAQRWEQTFKSAPMVFRDVAWDDYVRSAFVTVRGDLSQDDLLMNAGVGLACEAIEFLSAWEAKNPDLVVKELGDVMWYAAVYGKVSGFRYEDYTTARSTHIVGAIGHLLQTAGTLGDDAKKVRYHGHTLNTEKACFLLSVVISEAMMIAEHVGVTLQDVLDKNIEKLRKRYPAGFSTEASKNRAE